MTEVLTLVKQATKQLHEALESVSYTEELMSGQLSFCQYTELIQKNHFVYQRLEPSLNDQLISLIVNTCQPFLSQRLLDLEKDLPIIGRPPIKKKSLPEFTFLIPSSLPWTLGVLYVMEGSRLGGRVIVKALRRNPALANIPDFYFYEQANIDVRKRWLNLVQLIQKNITTTAARDQMVNGAKVTFEYFYTVHRQINFR